jgi:hypothetical protein
MLPLSGSGALNGGNPVAGIGGLALGGLGAITVGSVATPASGTYYLLADGTMQENGTPPTGDPMLLGTNLNAILSAVIYIGTGATVPLDLSDGVTTRVRLTPSSGASTLYIDGDENFYSPGGLAFTLPSGEVFPAHSVEVSVTVHAVGSDYYVNLGAWVEAGVVLLDEGFENGTNGASLDPGIWSLVGSPQADQYSTTSPKVGSQCAYIKSPTTAAYGGICRTFAATDLLTDGAEIRFWLNIGDTTGRVQIESTDGVHATPLWLYFGRVASTLEMRTSRTTNLNGYGSNTYTALGSYATGWMRYRIKFDFTNQYYHVYRRANNGDAWTELYRSGADSTAIATGIPMAQGSGTIGFVPTLKLERYPANVEMWVDQVEYSNVAGAKFSDD